MIKDSLHSTMSSLAKKINVTKNKVFASATDALSFYKTSRLEIPKGNFQTWVVPFSQEVLDSPALKLKIALRMMKSQDWINNIGSEVS